MFISGIHHISIICSDYGVSKKFYNEILGFEIIRENFRAERNSWKLDLKVDASTQIELFSFPNPPLRVSSPEACGLRHLAFRVNSLDEALKRLHEYALITEPIRFDEFTAKRFSFFQDPDGLPLEIYEEIEPG